MLYIKLKKLTILSLVAFIISSILFATNVWAQDATATSGLFGDLISRGGQIFQGMREIIFAVSGFGIVAIAIGGFFGNFNWKWLSAIIIGLMVISLTAGLINYMVERDVISSDVISDTLISGDDANLGKE